MADAAGGDVPSRRGVKKAGRKMNLAAKNVQANETSYKTFGNNYVWVPHEQEGFVLGEILNKNGAECEVRTEDGVTKTLPRTELHPINPPKFDGCADMASLGYLNEPSVLYNLKQRYNQNKIYTYSGLFLVAINPYKALPVYGQDTVDRHKGRRRDELEPHVYAVADESYRQMLVNNKNQSMLITGESGAGKTENTKKVIQYLTSVAGQHSSSGRGLLEEKILQANPIMEAFGNAKTIKNNNSSRFGKFIEIQFNPGGLITGTTISTYLLEKSRVISRGQNERNFHIFYQMISGLTPEEKSKWKLGDSKDFAYLKNSVDYVDGMNDAKEFADTRKALDIVGFTKSDQDSMFQTTAGLLHLGNIAFQQNAQHFAEIKDKAPLVTACQLLGLDQEKLILALTKPNTKAGNDIVRVAQTVDQSNFNRDALVKHVYGKLFDWLVAKINQSLASKDKISTFIGVLDIAGFEIFQENSFEQLCINYTNEKLQQFFNSHMFRKEQEEYVKEQIEWTFIDFGLDLQDTIDLIEKKNGLLALLEEQCYTQNTNEEQLVLKFIQTHKDNAYFMEDKFSRTKFGVVHYAGEVFYTALGWVNKNNDPLQEDCKTVANLSDNAFVRSLFDTKGQEQAVSLLQKKEVSTRMAGRFQTVSVFYKGQLQQLMSILEATEPHFIRCIIPNLVKKPGVIDAHLVLNQLRCNGVLEGIRISRKGYPSRIPYDEFFKRYYILGEKKKIDEAISNKDKAKVILTAVALPEDQFKLGLTKVFLRTGQHPHLEDLRERKIAEIIVIVQAACRGYIGKQKFKKVKAKVDGLKLIQKNWRSYLELRDWGWYSLFMKIRPMLAMLNFQKEMEEKDDAIKKLNKQLAEEAERKKQMEQQKADLENALASFKQEIYNGQEERNKLSNKIAELDAKLRELNDNLDSESRNRENLDKNKREVEKSLSERETELMKLNQKLREQQLTTEQLQRELNNFKNGLTDQEKKSANLASEKASLERQIKDLELRLADEVNASSSLGSKNKNMQKDMDELRETLARSERERNAVDMDRKKVATELKTVQEQLKNASLTGDKANQELKKIIGDLTQTQAALEEEKRVRAELEKKRKQLEADLTSSNAAKDDLDRERENLVRQKRNLDSQLEEARFNADHLGEAKAQLENINTQLQSQLDDLKSQLNKSTTNVAQLEAAKNALEKQIKDLGASHEEELNKVRGQLEQSRRKFDSDVQEVRNQLEESNRNYQASEKNRAKVDRELKEANSALQSEQTNRKNLEDIIKRLEAEIRELKAKLDEESKKRADAERLVKKLQGEISNLKSLLDAGDNEKEKIERATQNLRREIEELNAKLAEEEDEKHALQSQKDDLDRQLADANRQLADKASELNRANAGIPALKKELEDRFNQQLADEQTRLNSQLENLKKSSQQQIAELTAQLSAAKSDAEKYKRKHKADSAKFGQSESELRTALSAAQADAQRFRDDAAALKSQLDNLNASKGDLENAKSKADAATLQLKSRVEEAEAEKNKLAEANKRLQKELADAKEQLEEEESEKDGALSAADEFRTKAELAARDLQSLQAKFGDADEERNRLRNEINQLKELLNQANTKLTTEVENTKRRLEQRVSELTRQVESEQQAKADLAEEKKDIAKDLKDAQKEIASLRANQGGASSEQVRALENQIAKLNLQVDDLSKARAAAEAAEKTAEDKVRDLQAQLEDEVRARKRTEESRKKTAGDLDALHEEIEELEERVGDLNIIKVDLEAKTAQLAQELAKEREDRLSILDNAAKYKREAEEALRNLAEERIRAQEEIKRSKRKLEADLAEMEEKVRSATRVKATTAKSEKRFMRDLEELRRRLDEEARNANEAKDRAYLLEKQCKTHSDNAERANVKIRTLESENSTILTRFSHLEDENERLRREVNSLKSRLEAETRKRRYKEKALRGAFESDEDGAD